MAIIHHSNAITQSPFHFHSFFLHFLSANSDHKNDCIMAAYASLLSIMQIIHQIEHHPSPPISVDKRQVESLTEIVVFLQEFLEGYNKSPFADNDEADPLEMRIADAVYAAEDIIESHIVDQISPAGSSTSTSAELYESLVKVIEEMNLIKKETVAVKNQLPKQGSATSSKMPSNNSSASSLSRLNNTTMVGFDDVMLQLREKLVYGEQSRQVIPIVGMGGIGKTTLAINVYAHPSISHRFDKCAWVTISQNCNTKELLCEILSQANKQGNKEEMEGLSKMSEDEIGLSLHKYLSYRRYLIVLDDMWSIEAWEKLQCYFPNNSNGSRIMVTTRLSKLGSQLDNNYGIEMKFLDEQSSWTMFCKIAFRGKTCPLELEKIGKKIVERCRGLPLSIDMMGGLLGKLEQTKECWKAIRGSINSLVNLDNDKHCLKILKLSYNHLPVYLKPCFLYLGIFEEDSEIRVSRVIELWVSEGFLKPICGKSLETVAKEYLDELVDRNLILVHKFGSTGNMKYCKIHDLLRDLCLREAQKERFYDVVGQHSPQGTCSQRRAVIQRRISKEKVVDYMKSRQYLRTCISDRERVQLLPNLRLLRTLKAHDKFFDEGHEYSLGKLFELVNMRLLVVHSDGHSQLPSSIQFLWSLQTLVVSLSTRDITAPVEIWNMPQLRHVHVRNGALHLQDRPSDSIIIMENLQTLKGVSNFKCDEMMVRRIPNIKKLGLFYREDDGTDYHDDGSCVHNIERLQKLESFSCYCFRSCDFLQNLTFPNSLKSLTLEIKYGSIEDILEKVSTLPLLQKLKLKNGSFTTGKWETVEGQFPSLKFLSLAYCRHLEWWTMESSDHFPCLEHLRLLCMFDLNEIPAELGETPTLKSVTLEQCSESAVKSAKTMAEEQEELQFKVAVSLWFGNNEELQSLANPPQAEHRSDGYVDVLMKRL